MATIKVLDTDVYKRQEYEYETTKDGEVTSAYPDADNHHIDGVRYGTCLLYTSRPVFCP